MTDPDTQESSEYSYYPAPFEPEPERDTTEGDRKNGEFPENIQMEVNVGELEDEGGRMITGLPQEKGSDEQNKMNPQDLVTEQVAGTMDDSTEGIDLEKLLESCFEGTEETVDTSPQLEPLGTNAPIQTTERQLLNMAGGDSGRIIILQNPVNFGSAPPQSSQIHLKTNKTTDPKSNPVPIAQYPSGMRISVEGTGHPESQQQIMIPLDQLVQPGGSSLEAGNTVLLPVIPTLTAEGVIEMRLATNAMQNVQFLATGPGPVINTLVASSNPGPSLTVSSDAMPCTSSSMGKVEGDSLTRSQLVVVEGQLPVDDRAARVQTDPSGGQNTTRIFKCRYCDYSNAKRYLLVRHMKSHSEERPFKCTVCERSFKTNSSLQNHVNTHTGTKPFKCKICPSAFTTSGEMVRHMRYIHTKEKPHQCSECEYATVELSKLKRHMRCHTGERPFKCQVCSYSSPDMYKLKRHMRTHTGERPYECDTCLARFSQSNSLKAHKLIHTPDEKPSFQCTFCPTTCGRKTDLKLHIQKQHTSDRPIPCIKCGSSFPDKWSWKQHQKTHEGQKCFSCPHCPYSAFSQRHLEQHSLVHANQKSFQCPEAECGKSFRQLAQLKRHTNLKHNPSYDPKPLEKTHPCSMCDKKFKHPANLKKHHQISHSEDKGLEKKEGKGTSEESETGQKTSTVILGDRKVVVHIKGSRKTARVQKRRPQDLGLTNVRLKGRPRNVPTKVAIPYVSELEIEADEDEIESEEGDTNLIDHERTREIDREVESAFGFKDIAVESVDEVTQNQD